jgi:serine/threonine protein kinase
MEFNQIISRTSTTSANSSEIEVSSQTIVDELLKSYGEEFFTFLKSVNINMRPIRLLGSGVQGQVYLICHNDSNEDCKVVKIEYLTTKFEYEVNMQREFYKIGLAPKVIKAAMFISKSRGKFGAIIMDRVDATLDFILKILRDTSFLDRIVDGLIGIIKKLCTHGLIHGDMVFENIAYDEGKLSLIDFGRSCCLIAKGKCNPKFEIARLLSSCLWGRGMKKYGSNCSYLVDKLNAKIEKEFNITFFDNEILGSINMGESEVNEDIISESWNLYQTKYKDFISNVETSKIADV